MSSDTHYCDHCHATSTKSWHKLTPGLAGGLIKFKRAVISKGENSVHTRKDMDGTPNELTKGEYANWTKLRFLGLVAKDDKAGAGYWLLTTRGNAFLRGEAVPSKAQTMNNVVRHDHGERIDEVTIEQVYGSRPYFEDINDIERERQPLDMAQSSLFDVPVEEPEQRRTGEFFGGAAA